MGQTPTVIFKYAHHLLTHTHSYTHGHAHTSICAHIHHAHTHTHAYTNQHTWPCKKFIWCFLVIATKTPNLDVSHLFPRTPEWRANFKQPPPLTRRPLSFFSPADLLFFSSSHLRGEKRKSFIHPQVLQTVICLREAKPTEIPNSSTRKVLMPLCLQIPHV